MTWQPIETAPQDGRRLLTSVSGGWVNIGAYDANPRAKWPWKENHTFGRVQWPQPTHWMPLPEGPES